MQIESLSLALSWSVLGAVAMDDELLAVCVQPSASSQVIPGPGLWSPHLGLGPPCLGRGGNHKAVISDQSLLIYWHCAWVFPLQLIKSPYRIL